MIAIMLSTISCLAQTVTIRGKGLSLQQIFLEIERQSGCFIAYRSDLLDKIPPMDLDLRKVGVKQVLDSCLSGLELDYRIANRQIIIYSKKSANSILAIQPSSKTLDSVCVLNVGWALTKFGGGVASRISVAEDHVTSLNIAEYLQGMVPGMTIRRYNGVPGSDYGITIRGRHSIEQGTDPLILVNGLPIAPNNISLGKPGTGSAQGLAGASMLAAIPPSAIENIQVLKDAAATSLYGSRGANGIVLITLRASQPKSFAIDAAVSSGITKAIKTSPLLNTGQYLKLRQEAVQNDGFAVNSATIPELGWETNRYTDFKKLVTGNTRMIQDLRLDLSGGKQNSSYLLSGSAYRTASVFPGSTAYDRKTLYGYLHQQAANGRLQINGSSFITSQHNNLPLQDPTYTAYLAPNTPAFEDAQGHAVWSKNDISFVNIPALQNNSYRAGTTTLFGSLQTNYRLSREWIIRSNCGYYLNRMQENSRVLIAGQDPNTAINGGMTYEISRKERNMQMAGSIEYSPQTSIGQLTTQTGVEYQTQETIYSTIYASGYPSDDLLEKGVGNATAITKQAGSGNYKFAALFTRANYMLNNRYIVTLSMRREGSSRFGPRRRWGDFWALSGAWVFDKESFIPKPGWLSKGILRGSIGTSGNDRIGDNLYDQVYTSTASARGYQGIPGVVPVTLANPDLAWEVNYSSDLSLELGFINNRLLFSATAYRDWTGNQLIKTVLPLQTGLSAVYKNVPVNILNKGLELWLEAKILQNSLVSWKSGLQLTLPVNRLEHFPGLANSIYAGTLVPGRSLSATRALHYKGVDPATGVFQFDDRNRDGRLDGADWTTGRNTDPRCFGGITQTLAYKNWKLDLLVEFRFQNGLNPYMTFYRDNPPGYIASGMLGNGPVEWLDHWRKPGDHATLQKLTSNPATDAWQAMYYYMSSDATVIDASFIRLKRLSLAYNLKGKYLHETAFYLAASDLLTFTHYPVTDPETQDPMSLPPTKSISIGMRTQF